MMNVTECESKARYRDLIENAPLGIVSVDLQGQIQNVNHTLLDILGSPSAEATRAINVLTFPPLIEAGIADQVRRCIEQRQPMVSEHDYVTRWGKFVHVRLHLAPIRDAAGVIVGVQGIAEDTTERVQAEEALHESQERLQLAVQGADLGLWDLQMQTGEVVINPRWAEMLGYAGDEMEPHIRTWQQLTHPDDLSKVKEAVDAHVENQTPFYEVEYRLKHKSGAWEWVLARGQVVRWNPDGEPVRMAGTHLIVTERKQAEQELERYRSRLEELVQERTVELKARVDEVEQLNRAMVHLLGDLQAANVRSAETARQLQEANAELESFSYSVSHDLRAPLRHMNGFVRLLLQREQGRLDETSLRYLDIVAESASRMSQLIDSMLALSRIGRLEMRFQRVELNPLVEAVQQELATDTEGREIEWQIAPLPAVEGDPSLLRQVWVNLLSNALKYTAPRQKARIEIGTMPPDMAGADEQSQVTLFVRDNGVGFDPQHAHKLFGVFQRLHGAEEFEGTGIGLAIVRRIIQRHSGQIWAQSEPDRGATFYLTLKPAP